MDLYVTFLASAVELGARLPLKPSEGEGWVFFEKRTIFDEEETKARCRRTIFLRAFPQRACNISYYICSKSRISMEIHILENITKMILGGKFILPIEYYIIRSTILWIFYIFYRKMYWYILLFFSKALLIYFLYLSHCSDIKVPLNDRKFNILWSNHLTMCQYFF